MQIERLPAPDATNGWSAVLPPRTARPALSGEVAADWAVLGAGYAGLAAARRLADARPGDRVALIDAGVAGENASGRNSGFAIDLPHNVGSSLDELEGSHRFMRLARGAIAQLEASIDRAGIDCDWSLDGRYHAAVSPGGVEQVLKPYAAELEALGEPHRWVDGDELAARVGSRHFTAAVFTPGGALMNPAALTRGLTDSLPENVDIYEQSPVIAAEFQNDVRLQTPNGLLRAPKLIVAANGWAEQFGFYPGKFMHVVAWGSLTRPLTDEEAARYGAPGPWGLTPANAFAGITMRYTNDRRILIRHGLNYCPSQTVTEAERRRVAARHKRLFDARFPMLKEVEIAHTWSGMVCLSRNAAPGFGQLAGNIWSAVCQNAVGVTKGTFSGMLAADLAMGAESELLDDMRSLGEPDALPPRPFLDLGVRARFMWELWANRREA